jgi:hypothetical protein
MGEYVMHYHTERDHQGKWNVLLFPGFIEMSRAEPVRCCQQRGGFALLPSKGRVNRSRSPNQARQGSGHCTVAAVTIDECHTVLAVPLASNTGAPLVR